MRKESCSRTVVDWILTLAHPFIKHIPTVLLTRCITFTVRSRWETILDIEYRDKNDPSRAHCTYVCQHDMDIISQCSIHDAPVCKCPLPCDWDSVQRFNNYEYLGIHQGAFNYRDEFTLELLKCIAGLCIHSSEASNRLIPFGCYANVAEPEAEHPEKPNAWYNDVDTTGQR